MANLKFVIDSAIPFIRGVLEPWAECVYLPGKSITPQDINDADALVVRTRTRCGELLLQNSKVKLVATATIGCDHIDMEWCASQNIRVANAAGCNARGVLQWVAAALAYLSRRQRWKPKNRTLGIVGVGHVGSLVKQYAELWGFRVICCDPPRESREHLGFKTLDEVAKEADILTFHTPLTPSTYHMVNMSLVRTMKPGVVLLNSSRGSVIDEIMFLQNPNCSYIFDVWENEPRITPETFKGALLATPHIAGYTIQGKANATAMTVATLSWFFRLPIPAGWYPPEASYVQPRRIEWPELCDTIKDYFDIKAESDLFKDDMLLFERLRDKYKYRTEYF